MRSTAVDMTILYKHIISREQHEQLDSLGYIILENYVRPIKITQKFLGELTAYDVFKLYRPHMAELMMIHGDADEFVSLEVARRFSEQFAIPFIEVKGVGHRFAGAGETEHVINTAVRFYKGELSGT